MSQEVFLRLYRRMGDYDAARPPRPWVFGFAYRAASDYRKLARHRREVKGAPEEVADPSPAADERLVERDRTKILEQALDALPLERRAVFVLHELEGLPVAEIGSVLGMPANTAGSRLRVARTEFAAAVKRLRLQDKEAT